jgi:hypothetical protein
MSALTLEMSFAAIHATASQDFVLLDVQKFTGIQQRVAEINKRATFGDLGTAPFKVPIQRTLCF